MIKVPGRAYLAASTFYRLFSGLLVLLILARYLTAEALGVSAVAIAVGAILSTAQDWGQNNVILREIGRKPEDAAAVTSRSVGLRLVTTIIPLVVLPVAAYAATPHFWIPVFLVVTSGSTAGLAELVLAPNRALGRFFAEFCAVAVSGVAYIALVFIAASMTGDLVTVSLAMLVARGLQLGVSLFASRAFLHGRTVLSAFGSLRRDLSQNASLAVEGTLIVITNQLDTLVLANLLPLASLGAYQAGARFVQSVSPLASILSVSSIPRLAGAIEAGTQHAVLRKLNFEFFAVALSVLLGFIFFGPIISNFVYQQKYPELSYLWPAFGVYAMLRLAAAPANVYFISAGLSKHAAWLRFFFAVTLMGSLFVMAIPLGLRGVGHALCLAAGLHFCAACWLYAKEAGQWKVAAFSLGGFLAISVFVLWVLG